MTALNNVNNKHMDWSKLKQEPFPADQYYSEEAEKKQIVIHHTVSPDGVSGDINWWKTDPRRVATCIIIARDGTMHQLFSSKAWAHHLGITAAPFNKFGLPVNNTGLNKHSVAVELDSWGGLVKNPADGRYYNAVGRDGKFVPGTKVVDDPVLYPDGFRGFTAFERYTTAQIESLRGLLRYWASRYDIPTAYNEDIFTVNKKALSGEPGIWSHVSYRYDKSDCHPQPDLIEMLRTL